ncbi:MAG: carbohydrate porin [Phycisphaerales bacterium]
MLGKIKFWSVVLAVAAMTCSSMPPVLAQDTGDNSREDSEFDTSLDTELDSEEEASPEGILPLRDYSGDLWSRSYLLGDVGGARSDLAAKGIQFGLDWTQTVQGVVDGGHNETTRYGGSLDYTLTLDLHRMDLIPGAVLSVRAESRYGNSVNGAAGPLLPVNVDAFFPLTTHLDEDIEVTVTALNYMQFLTPQFGFILGKIDTLDGDQNEFASGRGVSQFMNSPFVFNPVGGLTIPYSTLAAGVVWIPNPHVHVTSAIMNAADSSTTTGFSDFGDGWNWSTEVQFQYRLGDLPGGQTIGVMYATDREFITLGPRFVSGQDVRLTPNTEDDSWFVTWNGWQYLWTEEEPSDAHIDVMNGVPDLQGMGVFARAGIADEDTNPTDWTISAGMGGRGIIPGRDHDVFGVGYFYTHVQADKLLGGRLFEDHSHGLEAFYNLAITPAAALTFDVQISEDPFPATDTSVLFGARLHMRF